MKKIFKLLICAAILIFAAINAVRLLNPGIKTQIVQHGEMEKSYEFDALIIRDETVVTAERSGILETMVGENEMVRKNKHIASIYESEVDEAAKKKLISINERIEEIQNALANNSKNYADSFHIESAIDSKLKEAALASKEHNASKLSAVKSELGLLNDRKNTVSDSNGYSEKTLAELKEEKAEYESKLSGSKQDLYSPVSGIFSTKIDGYEELVTSEAIGKMTPGDFESILKTKVTQKNIDKSKVVCKIIDSFEWSVAVVVTENELSSLETGDTVYVRMKDSADEAQAVISYISAPENGKYLLIATSDVSCDWANTERVTKVDFVKNKYKGLKIPSEALRVKDGTTGVYTVVDGIVKFKKVNVYYKDGKYAIAEENNANTGGLLLYDEVIVSSGNIKAGKRINK